MKRNRRCEADPIPASHLDRVETGNGRATLSKWIVALALILLGLVWSPAILMAAGTFESTEEWVDETHEGVTERLMSTARWLDSFFYDERYKDEENRTQLKLRLSGFWQERREDQYRLNANLRLSLPATEKKLMLVFSGDGDDGLGYDNSGSDFDSIEGTPAEERTLSLQYFIKSIETRNISMTLGGRIRDDTLVVVPGVRWRETIPLDPWIMRFTQNLRWYSDIGWESKTTLDFDHAFAEGWLFRATGEGLWNPEEEDGKGFQYYLNLGLIQSIAPRKAAIYELNNSFQSLPSHRLDTTVLKLRYRQQIWRKWLFFEAVPQVAIRNEDDYEPSLGCEIIFEAIFGHLSFLEAVTGED